MVTTSSRIFTLVNERKIIKFKLRFNYGHVVQLFLLITCKKDRNIAAAASSHKSPFSFFASNVKFLSYFFLCLKLISFLLNFEKRAREKQCWKASMPETAMLHSANLQWLQKKAQNVK
jgi:hypothetical protein